MKTNNYYGYLDLLSPNDIRIEKYRKQLIERGFDDSELWSLDSTMFQFLHLRLKRLVEIRKEVFKDNKRTKGLERLSAVLDEWSKDYSALVPDEAYKLLAKYAGSMWY